MASPSVLRLLFPVLCVSSVTAQSVPDEVTHQHLISGQQSVLEQQRRQQLQEQFQHQEDVRLDSPRTETAEDRAAPEEPCFTVNHISLVGDGAADFDFALKQSVRGFGFRPGACLGANGINRIMKLAQNAVISKGYTTTRILAAPQDLNSGTLVLTVMPGRIRSIRVDAAGADKTHAGRIAAFQNEFPTAPGEILNLRHLEQGLENLKRIPTAEADIKIIPADTPSESDIVIVWRQREVPFRVSIGVDDGGSRSTGKYQGSVTLSADNPLGLSDLFYVSFNRDLGHKASYTDAEGRQTGSGTNGYNLHYSVPFGYWQAFWNHSYYRYHQAVAGDSQNYDYNGRSYSGDFGISRLLHRSAQRKTHLTAKLWQRESESFINDAAISVQHRRTAGWSLGLAHKEYLGRATLDFGLDYKRGTGWNNSLPAPEEALGEGTSRMKILTADLGLNLPFDLGAQMFVYDSRIYAQWNRTPLMQQDRLSIGNRHTVRGFDGETVLSAERGGYWRNDLSWHYRPMHRLYVGIDAGRVSGPSAKHLVGQTLTGAAVGLKGQFNVGGNLSYNVFAGKPLHKPAGFRTASTAYGFNLNYSF
ncbi:ShlB/FhaC/HecB family hemolysin secretion/activation protein [Neisseria weaveri]|uniref:ShlB/FhaC/HecB family hemolysin secretion/activation protein n=1 Tax=Neisseria weaveri TaxID=28091 RepID=UPI000D2F4BF2|nr:ShlB/FhaC/HecB family hemolysin secretion/activation protein [Neisseria weaveri]